MKDKKKERERKSREKVLKIREASRKASKETKEKERLFHKSRTRKQPLRKEAVHLTNEISTPLEVDKTILKENISKLETMLKEFDDAEEKRKETHDNRG